MSPDSTESAQLARPVRENRILLVDDDPAVISLLGRTLSTQGRLQFATSGQDALRLARLSPPDLVLLDIEMPGLSGFDVCRQLKSDPALADVPVIFITGHDGGEHEVTGLELGAADFICKPIRPARVVARVRMHLRMKELSDALRRSAYTDPLTGIANRRQFDDLLDREWHRSVRAAKPMSLLMIDIDEFKRYNDHYGHPAGDRCLQRVALAVQQAAHRPADLAARIGGEEFALVLPETDAAGARHVAEQLLAGVRALALPHAGSSVAGHVTVSVGVSSFDELCAFWPEDPADSRFSLPAELHPVSELVLAADRALYSAKAQGRNRAWHLALDPVEPPSCAGAPRPAVEWSRVGA